MAWYNPLSWLKKNSKSKASPSNEIETYGNMSDSKEMYEKFKKAKKKLEKAIQDRVGRVENSKEIRQKLKEVEEKVEKAIQDGAQKEKNINKEWEMAKERSFETLSKNNLKKKLLQKKIDEDRNHKLFEQYGAAAYVKIIAKKLEARKNSIPEKIITPLKKISTNFNYKRKQYFKQNIVKTSDKKKINSSKKDFPSI